MPFLRMPEDNIPRRDARQPGLVAGHRAQPDEPVARLRHSATEFIRRQQLEQLQRDNNAEQATVQRYGHLLPPAAIPEIANMIYQGAPADRVGLRAAQLSGRLVDDRSDEAQRPRRFDATSRPVEKANLPVAGAQTRPIA